MAQEKEPIAGDEISEMAWKRADLLQTVWHWLGPRPGRVLIIRPVWADGQDGKPGYTQVTHPFTAAVKQKAIDEGWTVTDLSAGDATKAKVEAAINNDNPDLILHWDHGGTLTLCGQNYQAAINDTNVQIASGTVMSTVSCLSASGLGPVAIGKGVRAYLGFSDLHWVWNGSYAAMFAAAFNTAQIALLECKTAQQAFDAGWAAYDKLYNDLLAMGGFAAANVAPSALHDRDCFALLGTSGATACPSGTIHCAIGGPDMKLVCLVGAPNMLLKCKIGHPDVLHCTLSHPDMEIHCSVGNPDAELAICAVGGANLDIELCAAGPPLVINELIEDYPYDLVVVDMDKVPEDLQKPFRQMIDRMRAER